MQIIFYDKNIIKLTYISIGIIFFNKNFTMHNLHSGELKINK
jgi:hypothetical protein